MTIVNRVLWQDEVGVPGVVRERALPVHDELGDRKVLVKVHAWAINPCDGILQTTALSFVKYPVILGQDVAGTVEAVAPGSTAASKFSIGDRVFGFTPNNGFQEYVPRDHTLMAEIPEHISYRDAVVFGLCATTSSFSLFGKDFLHLKYPKLAAPKTGKSVLVWGGSSAAGSNAIQLATGAGYDVIATCSPSNFNYVKHLGAVKVFDYSGPTVIQDVAAELDKGECAGIYMAAGSNATACQVSAASKQKLRLVSSNPVAPNDVPEGVEAKFTFGTGSGPDLFAETLPATFGGYLPEALAKGVYKIAPPSQVVNRQGLEGIQEALDLIKGGVSATKLVVERP
ncbi:GroES-like protein [Coniochaeta ligniaria NRRL 30616]|uniref:GroES-like protein n=1 Tax=Coniochaeta ligniaria NRRL 30616 TaxID=1408157 RepID=A0A1J7I5E7_9PEZI|nr:GroES-like protein [Coniochaeta ligniaria NRRL 30616]